MGKGKKSVFPAEVVNQVDLNKGKDTWGWFLKEQEQRVMESLE